ncbi:myb-related transcription factor, partner of profilin-like [Dermacentor albipictus]|uniref:myb-related transcription factor, partner of profilin-like n=1 Tax=Dermacentor albipictus TaxID=60249 RepID=UPI0038FBF6B9
MAAAKGPRVSQEQTDILVQFIEQHPYLARASTEFSPRMTAARKNELWEAVAAVLNGQGPAVKSTSRWRNHWAKMAHKAKKEAARAASEKRATGGGKDASSEDAAGPSRSAPATTTFVVSGPAAVAGPSGLTQQPPTLQQPPFQPTPQPTPREPQAPPHRQSKQQDLEGAVHMATAEYVRQGQSAEARAQEEARFRRQMLEQNQRYGTPRQHVPFTRSDVPTYFAVIFFCRCVI